MKHCMDFGDTNFIGIANPDTYASFVDEDWELDMLLDHFASEMEKGSLIACQMTEEGIQHSWNAEVTFGTDEMNPPCFRRAVGQITVTSGELYLVDYDCLTMAAQFPHEKVPDDNCARYKVDIENGHYKVEVIQYFNVDEDARTGSEETDIRFHFIKVPESEARSLNVFWRTYW